MQKIFKSPVGVRGPMSNYKEQFIDIHEKHERAQDIALNHPSSYRQELRKKFKYTHSLTT